jgi:hypothetical protein
VLEEAMVGQQQSVVANGLKLIGETFVTGASQMLEGQVVSGIASFGVGTLAAWALAHASVPLAAVAVIAVKADSYSRSINGEGLLSRVGSEIQRPATETETASPSAPTRPAPSRSG